MLHTQAFLKLNFTSITIQQVLPYRGIHGKTTFEKLLLKFSTQQYFKI